MCELLDVSCVSIHMIIDIVAFDSYLYRGGGSGTASTTQFMLYQTCTLTRVGYAVYIIIPKLLEASLILPLYACALFGYKGRARART